MNYLAHFRLARAPFASDSPVALYPVRAQTNAAAALDFALRRRFGLVALVGPQGCGKSLLARLVAARLAADGARVVWLDGAAAGRLGAALCDALGLASVADAAAAVRRFAAAPEQAPTVVVLDEAESLSDEDLRLLMALGREPGGGPTPLRLLLVGESALERRLSHPLWHLLRSRIDAVVPLDRFDPADLEDYARQRLAAAAEAGAAPPFSPAALALLVRCSEGLPAVLHRLADQALQAACAAQADRVGPGHVRHVVEADPALPHPSAAPRRRLRGLIAWGLVLALMLLGSGVAVLRLLRTTPPAPVHAVPVPARAAPSSGPVKTTPAPKGAPPPQSAPVTPQPAPVAAQPPSPAPPAAAPVSAPPPKPVSPPVQVEPPPPPVPPERPPPPRSLREAVHPAVPRPALKPVAKPAPASPAPVAPAPAALALPPGISTKDAAPPPPGGDDVDRLDSLRAGSGVYPGGK